MQILYALGAGAAKNSIALGDSNVVLDDRRHEGAQSTTLLDVVIGAQAGPAGLEPRSHR